jgi:hypothetical protein
MIKKENLIVIKDENGIIKSEYGTTTTRGRELAERELRSHPNWTATFNGVSLKFVIGLYNDSILDSEILPKSCRAISLLGGF